MKRIMCVFLGLALTLGSSAYTCTGLRADREESIQQKKVEIKITDLPDAVKKAVKEDPYTGWTISKAYKIPGPDDTVLYEVELKRGPDILKATFDAKGNKIV